MENKINLKQEIEDSELFVKSESPIRLPSNSLNEVYTSYLLLHSPKGIKYFLILKRIIDEVATWSAATNSSPHQVVYLPVQKVMWLKKEGMFVRHSNFFEVLNSVSEEFSSKLIFYINLFGTEEEIYKFNH